MQNLKQRVELGAVQETMLMTLYARAVASRNGRGLLSDPRAVEIVKAIDYDFRRFADDVRLPGAVIRTRMLDEMVRQFLARAPRATIVEIGTGLNTRFERVDNGRLRWFDLDLHDVIKVRRRFFADTGRRTMIASSVLEHGWLNLVSQSSGPYLLVAEGVFGYLPEDQVREALAIISERLAGAVVVFDAVARRPIEARRDGRVWPGLRARLAWICEDPREVERWGLGYRLLESRSLADLPPALDRILPFAYRSSIALARVLGWELDAARLNAYRVE